MISREKAFEFISELKDYQGPLATQDLPAWIAAIREHLEKAGERWRENKPTAALHHIGSVAACAITAWEQHGADIRDDDPELN